MKRNVKRRLISTVLAAVLISTACGGNKESEVSHTEAKIEVNEEKEVPVKMQRTLMLLPCLRLTDRKQ